MTCERLGITDWDEGMFTGEFGLVGRKMGGNLWELLSENTIVDDLKTAVRMTFAKWRVITSFYLYGPGSGKDMLLDGESSTCGLCKFYSGCMNCPIAEYTGQPLCMETPYIRYNVAVKRNDWYGATKAALDELMFLRKVFPVTIEFDFEYFDRKGNNRFFVHDGDGVVIGGRSLMPMKQLKMFYLLARRWPTMWISEGTWATVTIREPKEDELWIR